MVNDLKFSSDCPFELVEGKPAITIVDNDGFKRDTMIGAGQSHYNNVMFVQPELFNPEVPSTNREDRIIPGANLVSSLSKTFKELGNGMQKVYPYRTEKRWEHQQKPAR